ASVPDPCRSAHVEARQCLRLFLEHLDALDFGATRPVVHEPDETLDRIGLPLENGFDGAVPPIRDPPGHRALSGHPAHRITKEHALDTSMRDDTPTDHGAYSHAHGGIPRHPETAPDGPRYTTEQDPARVAGSHRRDDPAGTKRRLQSGATVRR